MSTGKDAARQGTEPESNWQINLHAFARAAQHGGNVNRTRELTDWRSARRGKVSSGPNGHVFAATENETRTRAVTHTCGSLQENTGPLFLAQRSPRVTVATSGSCLVADSGLQWLKLRVRIARHLCRGVGSIRRASGARGLVTGLLFELK